MQYNVSIHKSQVHLLEDMVRLVDKQEMLAAGFYNCLIETDLPKSEFWIQWREALTR